MRLSKLHKAIISIQLAVLLILPVSADNIVTIEDYFLCLFSQSNINNDIGFLSIRYDAYANGIDVNNLYGDSADLCTAFQVEPNTTYTITYTLYTDVNQWPMNISFLGYTTFLDIGSNSIEINSLQYDENALFEVIDNGGTITYQVVFNSGEKSGLYYWHMLLDKFRATGQTHVSIAQHGVEATYDPGQDYFIEQILNTLVQIKNDNQNYHTNALDILNNMFNYGSDYPLPSGGAELDSAQTALSEAEGAISDKSSSIKEQISSQVQSNLELAASSADQVKQDSIQIKQLYATVTSSLPDEVKLLFVVVPLLLFVGWLIGRVRQ